MKKILFCLFVGLISICNNSQIGAGQPNQMVSMKRKNIASPLSDTDAPNRGYQLDDRWVYVNDIDHAQKEIKGSTYEYGAMDSWNGIYKYYYSKNDEMFVLLLSTVETKPTDKKYWDQRRWNNKEMKVTFSSSNDDVHYLSYSPKATVGSITTTSSVSVGAGSDGNISASLTYSESYTTEEVTVSTHSMSETVINITYSFKKYNTNTDLNNICCSTVDRQNIAIFKINNFSALSSYNFTITNEVSIYRLGVFNQSTETGTISQTYTIHR